jgi:hypothetical protein
VTSSLSTPSLAAQLPEPGLLWIRYVPRAGKGWRAWPGPTGPWLDLAAGAIAGWEVRASALPSLDPAPLDDVLYLPPVRPELASRRDELALRHLERGTPVLVQLRPGDPAPPAPAVAVYDLLPWLLTEVREETWGRLPALPAGAVAVWPLLPGIRDGEKPWEEACTRLAAAGVEVVQAVRPRLDPADRRRLADRAGEESFHALFHREASEARAFARCAHRHGLTPFLWRPLPRSPILRRENRRLAGLLALAGELWLRLGRPAEHGHGLFRAAREADRTTWDLASLARDGNLAVLDWLTADARQLVEESLAGHDPGLLQELMREYLGPGEQ